MLIKLVKLLRIIRASKNEKELVNTDFVNKPPYFVINEPIPMNE